MWWRMRRAFSRFVGFCLRRSPRDVKAKPVFTRTSVDLWRMARTRRLVTSVARVLATKPEVVAGIRKRLLTSDGLAAGDHAEVAIYFGDIQGRPEKVVCVSDELIIALQIISSHYSSPWRTSSGC